MTRRAILALLLLASPAMAHAQESTGGAWSGVENVYAHHLTRLLQHWAPAPDEALDLDPGPVAITCLGTAGDRRYVGMVERADIGAPLATVAAVLDDLDHFKDLFPDVLSVQVLPGGLPGARFATAWRQRAPIAFLPDVEYEMSHLVDKASPMRVVYRYKLRRGDKLIASDGMVVLEATRRQTTRYTEYDFFNGHWGPLPAWLVWRESLRAAFHSSLAIKLKAENPAWSYVRIAAEAKRATSAHSEQLDRCFAERRDVVLKP